MNMNSLVETLRRLLAYNVVYFTYRKVDGTIREAKGTRNLTLAGEYLNTDIPAPKTDKENLNAYYDLVKGAWRSFVPDNLISIDSIEVGGKITPINKVVNTMVKEVYCGGGKPETPKQKEETPKPTIEKGIGGLPIGFGGGMGFRGGVPKEEIHKAIEELNKDIFIPIGTPKGGTPMQGISLPIDCITIEDFAKMVAKYVVAELANKFFSNL